MCSQILNAHHWTSFAPKPQIIVSGNWKAAGRLAYLHHFKTYMNILRLLTHSDPTKTPCSHISGSHYRTSATLKFSQDPISFSLVFITMDGKGRPPIHPQLPSNLVTSLLCLHEYEYSVPIHHFLQQFDEPVVLIQLCYDFNELVNRLICFQIR